ncbi:MAG: hypothetical protein ACAI25_13865 [Planctomycetota bacterium]
MRLLALASLLALVAGCSGIDAREPLPPTSGATYDGSIAVSVTATYAPTDPTAFNTPGRYSPAIDAPSVTKHATSVLEERKVSGHSDARAATLDVSVSRADIKYDGQTGVFAFKVFFTVFFFPVDFPNYFISSDKFSLRLQAKWKLTEKNQTVAEGIAEGKQSGKFGDFSRGWYFVGYLRMPSPLNGEEFQSIADTLLPGAQESLAEQLVLEVERALAEKKKD